MVKKWRLLNIPLQEMLGDGPAIGGIIRQNRWKRCFEVTACARKVEVEEIDGSRSK